MIKNKGQSILEVLIAMGVLVISVSAIIIVGFGNQSVVVDVQLDNEANLIARDELEKTRALAREDFSKIVSTTTQDGIYQKEIIVTDIDTYTKNINSKITWAVEDINREINLNTIITDWRTCVSSCNGTGIEGDWTNPITAGTLDLGPGNEGRGLSIKDSTIYIVGEAADIKKDDIFSIDITDIYNPLQINSTSTGPGLASIGILDNYAFVANTDTEGQLQVIDISNPSNISLSDQTQLTDNLKKGNTIYAKDNYVYIGTFSYGGNELQVFDVSTPSNPNLIDIIDINATINDIYAYRDRLYIATTDANADLHIYDISDPSNLALITTYDIENGYQAKSVFPVNYSTLFVGGGDELIILNTSNTNNISLLSTYNTNANVNDIYVRDYLAFVATANNNAEFQVIDISNLLNPSMISSFNFPQIATGITYKDNVVFVSVRSNDALRIITSSP